MKKSLMDAPIHPSVQYTYLLTVNSNFRVFDLHIFHNHAVDTDDDFR